MDKKFDELAERDSKLEPLLRIVCIVTALLGITWLVISPGNLSIRIIPATLASFSLFILIWLSFRQSQAPSDHSALANYFIAENQKLEQLLSKSRKHHRSLEHYFETLMERIPANIYFKDDASRFLKVNQSMAESFDCGHPADLLGKTDHDFFDSDHADQALGDEKKILSTGKEITGQVEHETFSDGKRGWVLTTKMPFRDREGNIIGTFGMSSDVTELIETRNTLERERNMLRALIDSFPDKIFVRDPGRQYTIVNKAMAEWVGADSPEAMLGKTPDIFFPDNIATEGSEEDMQVIETGEPVLNREWHFHQKDKEIRIMVTTKVPLVDDDGRCWGIVGMDRDVTDQRRAREELLIANDNLQHAQEQLIQAEKMESVGRLASGVAHEVKNPLGMISMGIELLSKRFPEDDEKAHETVERMKRGITRAKKIVEGLVDFSSARQLTLESKALNTVVQDSLALVDYQLRKANVQVVEEFDQNLPKVSLDATKIEQVIVNLLINAQHAMPEGGSITIRTYTTRLDDVIRDEGARSAAHMRDGDNVVRIEIDDTGGGFSEENSSKIYDPFFTTKPTGVGTGLGLSVSRKIIELHHGTLELKNRPEGGVRARITFKSNSNS